MPKDHWIPTGNLSNIKVLVSSAPQHGKTGSGDVGMNRSGRNAFRYSGFLAVLVLMPALAFSAEPKTEAELKNFVIQDCGSCHGLTFKGGLGPPRWPSYITSLPDGALYALIR